MLPGPRSIIACVLLVLVGCSSKPVPAPPTSSETTPAVEATAAPAAPADAEVATPSTPVDPAAEAEAAWKSRAERSELQRAIDLWSRALVAHPDDPTTLIALSRAYVELADYHLRAPSDVASRTDALEHAIDAAERGLIASSPAFAAAVKKGTPIDDAVKSVEADKAAALATYGASLARYAVDKGFTALLMYRARIVAVMQRVIDVKPDTLYAIADRELGAFYARVPGFAGGDLAASRRHFDKALVLAPVALETRLRYAETYAVAARDKALFVKLLSEIDSADVGDAAIAPDNLLVKRRAVLLAATMNELF